MAIASWITLSKLSGNGNDTVTVSVDSINTGRGVRSASLIFKAAGCEDVIRIVNQVGKSEFSSFDESTIAAQKEGQTLTLSGTSNSSALTFSLGIDNIGLTLPENYTVAGQQVPNGEPIPGDPGLEAEYNWSIQFQVPANTVAENKACQVTVTNGAGHTDECTITQAAEEAFLEVSPESIELSSDGSTEGVFTVTSNTNWLIE